jgi:fructokinase
VPDAAKRTAAGIGELLWDELPGSRVLGGAPGNFARHAHGLGMTGLVISRVGDDPDGREILARLDGLGLGRDLVGCDPSHPTGRSTVGIDAAGVPSFRVRENAAWDFIEPSPELERAAALADAVAFGTLAQRSPVSRATIRSFLSSTRPGAIRLVDLNLRPPHYDREVVEASLRIATAAKLNEFELAAASEMLGFAGGERDRVRRIAGEFDLDLVALTRGEKGSVLLSKGRWSVHPGYRVRVADTVGAGDAFSAALVAGMLSGLELDGTNDLANRAASFVCSRAGATPELPEDLRAELTGES